MDQNNQSDLFEIKLDETGISYIRRLYKIASAFFVIMILWGIMTSLWSIRDLVLSRDYDPPDKWSYFSTKVLPWIWMAVNLINVVGTYYYAKFFRRLKLSIDTNNSSLFNQSFSQAIINALFALYVTIIVIVFEAIAFAMPYFL